MKLKYRWRRLVNYEFWPFWIFYLPFIPFWLWHSIRLRSFTWFTLANPSIFLGGFMNYSKSKILDQIQDKYKPTTKLYNNRPDNIDFYHTDFEFPFVCKPEQGERGKAVYVIEDMADWQQCFEQLHYPFILQEYIDWSLEFGVFYYRYPDGRSGISSITGKDFLTIVGNGTNRLSELVDSHLRAAPRRDYFKQKWSKHWNQILPKGQPLLLEPVGNHCKGTKFVDRSELINQQMVELFDRIVANIDGFYYGRFDLKVKQIDDLNTGSNMRIFELNGANSEATHIYDPNYTLAQAFRAVVQHLNIMVEICNQNRLRGAQPAPATLFFNELMKRR